MKRKVQRITDALEASLAGTEGVLAVVLGESADVDVSDPYFTIDLDAYVSGALPHIAKRSSLVPQVTAFETSPVSTIDRFLVEGLPVSVHYIRTEEVDRMLLRIAEKTWVFHEPGSHVLYRLERGEVLFSRDGWMEETRAALAHVPAEFWWQARLRAYALAERALVDLGAAAHRADDLFFLVSAARFLRGVASFLFAANRQFEPSDRLLNDRIAALPILPDGFLGRLDNFIRPAEPPITKQARREIAQHMIRSLMPLALEERD
ncbi:MAG TPA: DUF4037 domain-containing protein [Spirochaetia bacterium]|nr:DUF4037 domain-containing protein [Spirochaetia bacterium]